MNKQKIRKISYIVLLIAVILLGVNKYLDYQWEKESNEFNAKHEAILQDALASGDITYCNDYRHTLKCVYLIGKNKNDPTVCDLANFEEPILSGCKASVLEDGNYCKDNLEPGSLVYGCEATLHSLTGIGDMLK